MFNRQALAAYNLDIKTKYFIMGDQFINTLVVTQLPRSFQLGLLSNYVKDPHITMNILMSPLDRSVDSDLNREYKSLKEQYSKAQDETVKENIRSELAKLKIFIQEQNNLNDNSVNVLIVFSIKAETYEELTQRTKHFKERMKSSGFKLANPSALKMGLFKASNPLWIHHGIQKDVYYGLGVPMSATSLAGLYPFIYSQLKDPKGFLLGHEYYNGGMIYFDPMLYKNNPAEAKKHNRLTSNMIVVGKTGSGKTTDMSLIIMYFIRENQPLIWIDPENKNIALTKRFGGTFIPWGSKGSQINIFDLNEASFDEDEEDEKDPWDTELAIYNAVDDFKTLLKLYKPSIRDEALAFVGDIAIEMYHQHGITFDKPFRYLEPQEYPIISDFNTILQRRLDELTELTEQSKKSVVMEREIDALSELSIAIKPMLNEHKYYFDGHTTIPVDEKSKKIVSFGLKTLIGKPQVLRDSLNFLMFRYAWSMCLDDSQRTALVIDEAHEFILSGESAIQLSMFYRRSRKYLNSCVIGTQETRDFADPKVEVYSKAIFNNSTYILVKQLERDAISYLRNLVNINESEVNFIASEREGDALFICGNKRIPIRVLATKNELKWINPAEEI